MVLGYVFGMQQALAGGKTQQKRFVCKFMYFEIDLEFLALSYGCLSSVRYWTGGN